MSETASPDEVLTRTWITEGHASVEALVSILEHYFTCEQGPLMRVSPTGDGYMEFGAVGKTAEEAAIGMASMIFYYAASKCKGSRLYWRVAPEIVVMANRSKTLLYRARCRMVIEDAVTGQRLVEIKHDKPEGANWVNFTS